MKKWKTVINQEWMRAATCGEDVDSHGHTLPQLSSESRSGGSLKQSTWSQWVLPEDTLSLLSISAQSLLCLLSLPVKCPCCCYFTHSVSQSGTKMS